MLVDAETRNRIFLEGLVADFATRLNGAIDTWTLVCLGSIPHPNCRSFLINNADQLRSTLVVMKGVVANSFSHQNLQPRLKCMIEECETLSTAFLKLERFRTIDVEEIRSAVEVIRTLYHSLRANAQQIIEIVGIESPDALTLNPERQAYFSRILAGLFDLAIKERSLKTTPVATPA